MMSQTPDCPTSICLLADHLDTILAVGEDLMALELPPRADIDEQDPDGAPDAVDRFVRRLRQLEHSLLLRVFRVRAALAEASRAEPALRLPLSLFKAQTEVLIDLVAGEDRAIERGLAQGGDVFAFLRARGLIAPEAAAPSPFEAVGVGEHLRIGGIVELGPLLDLVASLLDLLDARYRLYPLDLDTPHAKVAQMAAATVTAVAPATPVPPAEQTFPSAAEVASDTTQEPPATESAEALSPAEPAPVAVADATAPKPPDAAMGAADLTGGGREGGIGERAETVTVHPEVDASDAQVDTSPPAPAGEPALPAYRSLSEAIAAVDVGRSV
jgi:hypothetical protein